MKLTRGEKKLFAFCALVLLLPLGIGAFFSHINAPPVVAIAPYPKAPQPNGYDLYVQAGTMIKAAKPPVGTANDPQLVTDPKVAAQRYGLKRKEAWLAANRPGYAVFERALQTPSLAPPARSFSGASSNAALRELARNTLARSDTFLMRGESGKALQSDLDIVQMGHEMRRGGALIATLNGTAIGAMGRSGTHVLLDKLDAAQAKAGARRLEKLLQKRWNLAEVLTERKYSEQSSWLEIFQKGKWRQPASFAQDETPSLGERWQVYTISKQRIIDDIGLNLDRQIANARLPYAQKGTAPQPLDNVFLDGFSGIGDKMRFNNARDLAGDQLLMLRLALRAHRLEKGVYPPALKALTPNYLSASPADPFGGGQPWRYQRDGQNYKLWSIGPDGRDDGGKPIAFNKPSHKRLESRPNLPGARPDSIGDIVAGKNS